MTAVNSIEWYLTLNGSVRIKKADSGLLVIEYQKGDRYLFSLSSAAFLDFFRGPRQLSDYLKATHLEENLEEASYLKNLCRALVEMKILGRVTTGTSTPTGSVSYSRPILLDYYGKIPLFAEAPVVAHVPLLNRLSHAIGRECSFLCNALRVARIRLGLWFGGSQAPVLGIFLMDKMGDIVASEPIVRSIKGKNPRAIVVWCVRSRYRELLEFNPHIDAVLTVRCPKECDKLKPLFDTVFILVPNGKCCHVCGFALTHSGITPVSMANYLFFGSLLSSFSLCGGLPPLNDSPKIYSPRSISRAIDKLGLPRWFVAIHRKSGESWKNWTDEKWRDLVRIIRSKWGLSIVEVGGKGDGDAALRALDLCGKLTILETAEVIRRSVLFVGMDSGPAHIANAVATPGVVLIGKHFHIGTYQPFSGRYTQGYGKMIGAQKSTDRISVDEIARAVEEMIPVKSQERLSRSQQAREKQSFVAGIKFDNTTDKIRSEFRREMDCRIV